MNATVEQSLMSKIRTLSPQQVAEVEDFVEFLATKARKRSALDRLLAIAPALEAAGAAPMSEDEIAAEIDAARVERRARQAAATSGATSKGSGADRS
jgi:urease accessory protein UreF